MKTEDRRKRTGNARTVPRVHGFVPIPGYTKFCGWCGCMRQFGHAHNMTVCGTCGN